MKNLTLISMIVIVSLTLSACNPTAATERGAPTSEPVQTATQQTEIYKESPELTQWVKEGKLPPVEERLPKNPLVVQPVEKVGVYGGDWRMGIKPSNDAALLIRTIGYENLVSWDPQWTRVIPNIAQSVDVSEDSTEYVFHLREGMKWSDGKPFTVDDIMFWYEDVFLNEELTPSKPSWLMIDNQPAVVEKIDGTTFRVRFAAPNGLFLQYIAQPDVGDLFTDHPKHYLQQFHKKYNPDGIDALVKAAGVKDWIELFQLKSADIADRYINPELPTLHAWVLTNNFDGQPKEIVAVRNPYYWKIDTAFNQLPYIDRVVFKVGSAGDIFQMALRGEIDMQDDRNYSSLENKAKLEANQEKGGYHFFTTISSRSNPTVISFNLTCPNPVLREIFQNRDFRIGLSYAINRQEIIDKVYGGSTEPYQAAPRPTSPFYNERLAKQYTEYDVALANEYLDKAGYSQKDGEGYRLGPDGKRISFRVQISSDSDPAWTDVMEIVRQNWQAVGIEARMEDVPREIHDKSKDTNQFEVSVWWGEGGLDAVYEPRYYFPYTSSAQWVHSDFAPAWAYWFIDPKHPLAEVPPETAQRQMDLYNQLKATSEADKQNALMAQILEIAADEFYVIGVNLNPDRFGLVKNNFHNVPAVMPSSWTYPNPAPTNPCQYFIESQE